MNNTFFDGLPIYFINLDRSKERYISIMKSFKELGIKDYCRVKAIDSKNIKDDSKVNYLPTQITFSQMGMGHFAAALSYFKAYNEFLKSDYEYALFCDDDVDFSNSLKMNFNFYDTLEYHNPKFYNLKVLTLDSSAYWNEFAPENIEVGKLMKPTQLSVSPASIVNKKWVETFLVKYNILGKEIKEDSFYDFTPYHEDYLGSNKHLFSCTIDKLNFDKYAFLWSVFSLMDTHKTSSIEKNNFETLYGTFGIKANKLEKININTFIENGER